MGMLLMRPISSVRRSSRFSRYSEMDRSHLGSVVRLAFLYLIPVELLARQGVFLGSG